MRLWSLHPKYLDRIGLIACWREGLLAKAVLEGKTKGYTHHPQLIRFQTSSHPLHTINQYLTVLYEEGKHRGFQFDHTKIKQMNINERLPITSGQIAFEWKHLLQKLRRRSPEQYHTIHSTQHVLCHPLFYMTRGPKASWEKGL
jgi:hypothetical protein